MPLRAVAILGVAILSATPVAAARTPPRTQETRCDPAPIRGGTQVPGGPLLHVFQPGPDSSGGMGVRIEPCTFTDFKGFVAVAFLRGSATDQDGHPLEADLDVRVFQGEY